MFNKIKKQENENRIPFIIYPDHQFKQIWEILNTISIILSCFITPVSLAFSDDLSNDD